MRDLIGLYLTALAAPGSEGLDPDTAWEQYRLHALYAWIGAAVTAAAATLQAEPIARAGLARSSAALLDLDALAALDRFRPVEPVAAGAPHAAPPRARRLWKRL